MLRLLWPSLSQSYVSIDPDQLISWSAAVYWLIGSSLSSDLKANGNARRNTALSHLGTSAPLRRSEVRGQTHDRGAGLDRGTGGGSTEYLQRGADLFKYLQKSGADLFKYLQKSGADLFKCGPCFSESENRRRAERKKRFVVRDGEQQDGSRDAGSWRRCRPDTHTPDTHTHTCTPDTHTQQTCQHVRILRTFYAFWPLSTLVRFHVVKYAYYRTGPNIRRCFVFFALK